MTLAHNEISSSDRPYRSFAPAIVLVCSKPRNRCHSDIVATYNPTQGFCRGAWSPRITCVASNEYPLHLVERHFLGAPIVELRRPRAGVVRPLRGLLKRPAVLEVGGDAGRPKRVVPDLGRDVGRFGAPLDHRVGVGLG